MRHVCSDTDGKEGKERVNCGKGTAWTPGLCVDTRTVRGHQDCAWYE